MSSIVSKNIRAIVKKLYQAFADAEALEAWLVPGEMTGRVHQFDFKEGGGYQMSLFYPVTDEGFAGKTKDKEDRYTSRYPELILNEKIVQAIKLDTDDPRFSGEMIMEISFEEKENETLLTISFENIPSGISKEDNEAGTRSSREKLARFVG